MTSFVRRRKRKKILREAENTNKNKHLANQEKTSGLIRATPKNAVCLPCAVGTRISRAYDGDMHPRFSISPRFGYAGPMRNRETGLAEPDPSKGGYGPNPIALKRGN